jgi:hypothetical protein
VTNVLYGNLLTGLIGGSVPFLTASLLCRLNAPGTVEVTVDLNDDAVASLNLKNNAAPRQAFLAWEENDVVLEAGPISGHSFNVDTGQLTITASGLWSYFDDRVALPTAALSKPFFVNDPNTFDTMIPNPALDTVFTNTSYANMYKGLIQQSMQWPSGSLPIVFQPDDTGSSSLTVNGVDVQYVGDVLRDINQLTNGPDIEFTPSRSSDRRSIQWTLRTGTTAKPDLGSVNTFNWDMSVDASRAESLKVDVDGSMRASRVWAIGGKSNDTAIIVSASDPTLTNTGFPILERVLADRNDLSSTALLQSYANEQVRLGKSTTETWSFKVQANKSPKLGEYRVGDYAQLTIGADNPYISQGIYLRRILSMSTDQNALWVSITTGEVYSTNGAAV